MTMMKYYTSKTSMSWDSSVSFCTNHDLNFITFESKNESKYYSKLNGNTWIGVHDMEVEGTYKNYYGRGSTVNSIFNWLPGEPNNGLSSEDCIELDNNGYNDANCGSNRKPACMSK